MPVTSQTPVNAHSGNGVTTVFAYAFKVLAEADLEVSVGGVVKTLTTDYSVSGVGSDGGGNVTFVSAPASGTGNVVIRRKMPYARAADYQDNGDLTASQADEDADRPIMMIQQLAADFARALKLPINVTENQEISGAVADRANRYIAFDSAGNLTLAQSVDPGALIVSSFIETLLDDLDAAAARETLGAAALSEEQTFSAKQTFGNTVKLDEVLERITITASAPVTNFDCLTQAIQYFTSNASANWTQNFRGDGSNTLNTVMETGESMTVTVMATQGATPYYPNVIQVDGSAVTPKWLGSAPTAGDANSINVYTFTIIKTGSATFTVLASKSKYA